MEGAERETSMMADIQYDTTQHGTNWEQKVAGSNPKSFINSKMVSLKIWVKKYNKKWKGQRLILLTLHQHVQVSSPIEKSISPVYCCFLQWLIDSASAVQGGRDVLSVSLQGHEGFRSRGTVNSTGKSRRGDRMAPHNASPASRILQGKSGRLDHRAVVLTSDCFWAREVGAASRDGATAVQRENQNIPCVCEGEKMPSIATPLSIPPGFLHRQIEWLKILHWGTDAGCSSATTPCCAVCSKLTFKTEMDFWTAGPWGDRAMHHY